MVSPPPIIGGGRAPNNPSASASGGQAAQPKRMRTNRSGSAQEILDSASGGAIGSTQNPLYGRADVKVYPINEDQLAQLGTLKGLSGACFVSAGTAFGFAINIYKDLAIQGNVPIDILAYWDAIRNVSFFAAIGLAVIGVILFWKGHHRLSQIKRNTRFNA